MIQFLELGKLSNAERSRIMRRAEKDIRELLPLAQEVIDNVRNRGDEAVVEYAREFDSAEFSAEMLKATPADFEQARASLEPEVIAAIEAAHRNILRFHEAQMPEPMWFTEVQPGIMAGEKISPIPTTGIYVPR